MTVLSLPTTPAELEALLSRPVDVEWEMARAARYRLVRDGRRVVRVPVVRGASNLAPIPTDCIYVNEADFGAHSAFTSEVEINAAPEPIIPANFFDRTYGVGKTLRVVARGVLGTVSSAACTFSVNSRIDSTTGAILSTMTQLNHAGTVQLVNTAFELEYDLVCRTLGASGTVKAQGFYTSPGLLQGAAAQATAVTGVAQCASAAVINTPTPAAVTYDTTAAHTILITAVCGTNNASNSITLLQLIVLGLN